MNIALIATLFAAAANPSIGWIAVVTGVLIATVVPIWAMNSEKFQETEQIGRTHKKVVTPAGHVICWFAVIIGVLAIFAGVAMSTGSF
jgi:uncharacterized membrane protein